MAVTISASIYGVNSNSQGTAMGVTMGFPASRVLIRPFKADSSNTGVYNTVTVQSIIQLIPSGTVVSQPQYFSSESVSALITKANA
jgi:hypothetical protein